MCLSKYILKAIVTYYKQFYISFHHKHLFFVSETNFKVWKMCCCLSNICSFLKTLHFSSYNLYSNGLTGMLSGIAMTLNGKISLVSTMLLLAHMLPVYILHFFAYWYTLFHAVHSIETWNIVKDYVTLQLYIATLVSTREHNWIEVSSDSKSYTFRVKYALFKPIDSYLH